MPTPTPSNETAYFDQLNQRLVKAETDDEKALAFAERELYNAFTRTIDTHGPGEGMVALTRTAARMIVAFGCSCSRPGRREFALMALRAGFEAEFEASQKVALKGGENAPT